MNFVVTLLAAGVAMVPQVMPGDGPPLNHAIGYYDAVLRRVVMVGGESQARAGDRDRVWSWSGERWEVVTTGGPPARSNAWAAYDATRRAAVVFGGARRMLDGSTFEAMGDTWRHHAGEWAAAAGAVLPPRDHHAMVYDEARGTLLLHGGIPGARTSPWPTDTWAFAASGWSRLAGDGPIGRARTALAYDRARKQVVMFGGIGDGPRGQQPFFNDTWVWEGVSWTQAAAGGPPARYAHGMAYDDARGVVLLYGGSDATGPLLDMWQWDGHRWTEIPLTGATPGARYQPVMVYDEARKVTVLYGGLPPSASRRGSGTDRAGEGSRDRL